MNLQQLEYILALNKHRHFGRAADSCNVSQPTLSTMIHKLEDELGVKLFERSRTVVIPTSIGLRVIEQAETILNQAALLSEIVQNESLSTSGVLRISVIPTIAPYLIPLISPALEKYLPDLEIHFYEYVTSASLTALKERSIDIALVAESEELEHYRLTRLYYEEFYAYVSRQDPLFAEESIRSSQVQGEKLWLLDEGHCFRDQLLRFCQLKRDSLSKHSYHNGSLQTFIHMVERNDGITFIPELALQHLVSEKNKALIRPFAIPRPCRAISFCTLPDYARSKILDTLGEIIRSSVPSSMLQLKATQQLM